MHCARSEAHFDLMARVGLAVARYGGRGYAVSDLRAFRGKGEEENAAWLEDSYCRAPWNGWWAGASEETGVTCSNNDIESFWRKLKTSMLTARRVGHRQLLEEVFPKMLFLVAQEHVGDPTRTSSHVSADTLNAASAIYNGSKTPIWQHAHGTWLVNSQAYKAVRAWRPCDSFRMSTLQVAISTRSSHASTTCSSVQSPVALNMFAMAAQWSLTALLKNRSSSSVNKFPNPLASCARMSRSSVEQGQTPRRRCSRHL